MAVPSTPQGLAFSWAPDEGRIDIRGALRSSDPLGDAHRALEGLNMAGLSPQGVLTVNLREITEFDSSGLAFLMHVRHELTRGNTQMKLRGVGAKLRGVLHLLELRDELGDGNVGSEGPGHEMDSKASGESR